MTPIVHHSKIDSWILAVLALAIVVSAYATQEVFNAGTAASWWSAVVTAVLGIGLPLWVLISTRYCLDERQLLIRSGPFRWQVPLREIHAVTPTRNPLSSPALSLDRLRIDYGNGRTVMISPRDREGFLRDLAAARQIAAP